jgi:integrase
LNTPSTHENVVRALLTKGFALTEKDKVKWAIFDTMKYLRDFGSNPTHGLIEHISPVSSELARDMDAPASLLGSNIQKYHFVYNGGNILKTLPDISLDLIKGSGGRKTTQGIRENIPILDSPPIKSGGLTLPKRDHNTTVGMIVGEVTRGDGKYRITMAPIVVKPETATEMDIILHAHFRQNLTRDVILHRLRYIRNFAMKAPIPYNPYKPEYEAFVAMMDSLREIGTPYYSLRHIQQAVWMFNRAFGIKAGDWFYTLQAPPTKNICRVPLPEVVYKFTHYDYPGCSVYERTLLQYIYSLGFYTGARAPNELWRMRVDDFEAFPNGKGLLLIRETKENREREVLLPAAFATSPRHKSLKNWIDHQRPESDSDALWIHKDGSPFTIRSLGKFLSQNGKNVWPQYHPYTMRHYAAIAQIIEAKVTKDDELGKRSVQEFLGHTSHKSTDFYIVHARKYFELHPDSWIAGMLRRQTANKPKPGQNTRRANRLPKNDLLTASSPGRLSGPVRI